MATYVNDLRLKEIATGDSSGTWGTETNVNLELIGEAMGYATKAVADASSSTITMPDGTATNGELRSLYLKLTGGGQASTITLAPNTISKVWFIENATSYTLTFTQGSGANVAVAAGQTKVIASDGAGSGAVLYDVMTDLSVAGDLFVADTVQPSGDTASGDAAAIGYTAAEGIIVTGQGSTSDVTIKNDADGTVLTVPTGTTNVDIVGVATAATFEPDGDTAAGDNAAIGYTAAEGLILTGQGSTNDVTIKNDADADVIEVPTGTVNVTMAGTVTAASTIVGNAGLHVKNGATGAGFVQFFEDSDNGSNKVTLAGPASTADITLTLPSSVGTSGQALVTNGSGVLSFAAVGGLYNDWLIKTANYTMVSGDQIIVNKTTALTMTLPSSPSAGDVVTVKATGGGTVTIGRNSSNINSTAADGTLNNGFSTQLVYVDGTIGWLQL